MCVKLNSQLWGNKLKIRLEGATKIWPEKAAQNYGTLKIL